VEAGNRAKAVDLSGTCGNAVSAPFRITARIGAETRWESGFAAPFRAAVPSQAALAGVMMRLERV
jgi:hypothetical protein